MAKLKAAILQCDDVLSKFQNQFSNYPEMVEEAFHRVEPQIDFNVYDVRAQRYPKNSKDYDFFVITGSKASVYDKDDWIAVLIDYVRSLDEALVPVFGICFGHQIMALTQGCEVQKAEQGWGVGVATNELTACGESVYSHCHGINMIVSHQDQVMNIPKTATLLAYSDFCPNFSVRWSNNLISIQGHPEWSKGYAEALMKDRIGRIEPEVINKGIDSLVKPLDNDGFIRAVLNEMLR